MNTQTQNNQIETFTWNNTGVYVVDENFNTITKDPVTRAGSFCGTEHAFKFIEKRQREHPRTAVWKTCIVIRRPIAGLGPVEIVKAVKPADVGTWFY